ncbi:HAMP domain-containing histidine kinase [Labilibaculum sp. DW002]|uniref:histidine kinase n=1 Tax=Paralabilibaculum antarcticum TaxID=2912572 RepID=A0ABT5VX75_9BACT|nr:HAMP domain-containing sensor histidine kinase [Labilibaculum sp. DW002]MBI9056694.1 HAMP domain-containing histidine kinase [Labilibaculum sp.]MDE5419850.1 HAMP domain-containing histidine kinase [Labilibaculum sp. DW002]
MEIYLKNRHWKIYFLLIALVIILSSIFYTSNLVDKLAHEEVKKVELWAAGLRSLDANPNQDVSLINRIMEENETIPVILVDDDDNIVAHRNIAFSEKQEDRILKKRLKEMREEDHSIEIDLVNGKNYIYFDDSNLLKRLAWYPFVQLGAIITFILIAYLAFSYSKSAEQNQVWLGMSKETAHQLGTPISSLMAWMELIKDGKIDSNLSEEMAKDVSRLEVIAERFSKIGSKPVLKFSNIVDVLDSSIEYLKKRTSDKVEYSLEKEDVENEIIPINKELFSWVIENLSKNAVDAMEGKGQLKFSLSSKANQLIIDISDTGKGIARNQFKTIFKPGFTSKKRGWGLGLSLSKRIIENYHRGKIFVVSSEMGSGAVFRIILPLN